MGSLKGYPLRATGLGVYGVPDLETGDQGSKACIPGPGGVLGLGFGPETRTQTPRESEAPSSNHPRYI